MCKMQLYDDLKRNEKLQGLFFFNIFPIEMNTETHIYIYICSNEEVKHCAQFPRFTGSYFAQMVPHCSKLQERKQLK